MADREGNIHVMRCYHNRLYPGQSWTPVCLFRKLTPQNIINLFLKGTLDRPLKIDLQKAVTHGQDIASDDQGRVWIAEKNSFRVLHPALFGIWYQWAIFFERQIWIPILFIFSIVLRLYHVRTRMIDAQVLVKQQNDELQELNQVQSRFFAYISHEFRTPLNLILDPLDEIRSKDPKDDLTKQYDIIEHSAERMLRLIDRLLKLSKLNAGKLPLKATYSNLIPFLEGITSSFELYAKRKQVSLTFRSNAKEIMLRFDHDKLEDIFYNLIGNAIKYTPPHGKILMECHIHAGKNGRTSDRAEINIRDTGCGIPEERLPHIFDLYYQAGDNRDGTGIGLALTKRLLELHQGEISVKSKMDWGTEFTIHLPLWNHHLPQDQMTENTTATSSGRIPAPEEIEIISQISPTLPRAASAKNLKILPQILLVEDQPEWRAYLRSHLLSDYQVIEAGDGLQGFERTLETDPDLIITDINLPGMNGFELCEKIKTDLRTSHIPVILLTGRVDEEDKIEGFEIGADDYISKPVRVRVLTARLKNLLEQRQKLREALSQNQALPPGSSPASSEDELFLQRVTEIIEKNLTEHQTFNMSTLAEQLKMSRKSLYRKLGKTIDMPVGEFVYELRLQRAAKLLTESDFTVERIAYEVGFSSGSHLAKRFKSRFDLSPLDYRKKCCAHP